MVPEAQNFFALKEDSPEAPCPGLFSETASLPVLMSLA